MEKDRAPLYHRPTVFIIFAFAMRCAALGVRDSLVNKMDWPRVLVPGRSGGHMWENGHHSLWAGLHLRQGVSFLFILASYVQTL